MTSTKAFPLVSSTCWGMMTKVEAAQQIAGEISGLADYLKLERKQVPDDVLYEADRLHCLLFSEYDLYFEGDEPPR